MYDRILVGTDGSESAKRAVERAMTLAEQCPECELHVVTVVNTKRYGEPALSSTELVLNELEDRARDQLAEVEQQAGEMDLDIVTASFHGEPSKELLDYAEEIDADLLVLGYRGQSHANANIGSTADRIINRTDRSVLLL